MIGPANVTPDFLYIVPDNAASTWIYEVFRQHPEIFMSPAKELFFFDYYFRKGWPWYLRHFRRARAEKPVIGEVSHDYLFSSEACNTIFASLPAVRLMVCLREPIDRAFSSYLYMLKQGRISGSCNRNGCRAY